MNTEQSDDFKAECEKQCPMECDRIDFDSTISGYEVNFSEF